MAMTLRLPEELDQQIEEIARARHTSKYAIVVEAAMRFASTEAKTERALRLADEIVDDYADTIRRLEDS
ncbi:MAG: hypothetical protein WDA07_07580 [Leucobacter sp.]